MPATAWSACNGRRKRRPPTRLAALVRDKLRPAVAELGGNLVVLSTAGDHDLERDDVWGPPGDAAAVMRARRNVSIRPACSTPAASSINDTNATLMTYHAIDAELLRACIHCGLCTSSCPTYVELGDENDGPRGRIQLMRR